MIRRVGLCCLFMTLLVGAPVAPASSAESPTRLYLLQGTSGDGYWSVDPADPELSPQTLRRTCGAAAQLDQTAPCFSNMQTDGSWRHAIRFLPGSLIETRSGDVTFSFHLVLDMTPSPGAVVRILTSADGQQVLSPPATAGADGAWEGSFTGAALRGRSVLTYLVIDTPAPTIGVSLGAGGRSWIDVTGITRARSVPQLQRESDVAAAPSDYAGGGRRLWFNDQQWTARSFGGDLRSSRTFTFENPAAATTLIAWVETFATPFVYDATRGRAPDSRKLENSAQIIATRNGAEVGKGYNVGIRGKGQDTLALFEMPAGPLDLRVKPSSFDPDGGGQELAYELHVVAVHGSHTLAGMRWRFHSPQDASTPVFKQCPFPLEPVPVPANVTTYAVDLDWDTLPQPGRAWTLRFLFPDNSEAPCGEATIGDRVRFTWPRSASSIHMLGPTPTRHAVQATQQDTVFEMDVRYTYGPAAS